MFAVPQAIFPLQTPTNVYRERSMSDLRADFEGRKKKKPLTKQL